MTTITTNNNMAGGWTQPFTVRPDPARPSFMHLLPLIGCFDIDKSVMQVVIIFLTRELGHQVVRVVRMLRAGVVVGDNAVIGINKDNIGLGGA
jgi:hypothetical protein